MNKSSRPAVDPALVSAIGEILEIPADAAEEFCRENMDQAQKLASLSPEYLSVGSKIGVYLTPRSRKFDTLFVRIDWEKEGLSEPREWTMWWSPTHCVGYFSSAQVREIMETAAFKFNVRVNNRISQ